MQSNSGVSNHGPPPLSAAHTGSWLSWARSSSERQLCLERLVFVSLLAWMFLVCCFPLADTDIWWHLRTGELILERGEVPYVDWYTFTDVDRPWIDLHWGFQLLMTLLHRTGGVNLIVLFKAAVVTLTVAIAWNASGRRLPVWLKAAVWIAPAIALSGRAFERPEMLSLLFLVLWIWVIDRLPERLRIVWMLPLIQLVWVNCHSLFVLGMVVAGCYAVDYLVRVWAGGRWGLEKIADNPSALALRVAGLMVVLAAFVNPYFEEGAMFPLEVYRKFSVDQEYYSARIGEFQQPIDFIRRYGLRNIYVIAELVTWLIAAFSFALLLLGHRRWSPFRALLFAGFSHLAWEASRNVNIFAVVAVAVTMANLEEWLVLRSAKRAAAGLTLRLQSRLRRAALTTSEVDANDLSVIGDFQTRIATCAMLAVFCGFSLLVVTGAWHQFAREGKSFGLGERRAWFAHDAVRFAGQAGFPNRAFVAHIGQAAVYSYHNGPDRRVFMDGRLEVCTRRTFEMFDAIMNAMAIGDFRWQDALRGADGGLPVVILDSRSSRPQINGMLNTPGWTLVFADSAAAVFVEDGLVQKLTLPVADPGPLMAPP